MKPHRIIPLLASFALSAGILFPHGASARTHATLRVSTGVPVTFRLHVTGAPAPGTTFWVAYGPSAGGFGIVQLHRSGGSIFTALRRFAPSVTLDLSYIEGHGTIHTRFGLAPGNPVRVIRTLAPAPASQIARSVAAVQYRAPIG